MKQIKKHIVTEVISVFFAVIAILILIMVSFQFAKLLAMAASGKIVGSAIFKLVALNTISLFVLLTPFAFFIACLITLSKFASDNELIAMKSVGHSNFDTIKALLIVAIPLAFLVIYLTLFMLPQSYSLSQKLTDQAKKESEISFLQPGNFRTIGSKTVLFVADINDKKFTRFFVWQKDKKGEAITIAKTGEQKYIKDDRYIELQSGTRFAEDKSKKTTALMIFDKLLLLLPEVKKTTRKQKLKSVPTSVLLKNKTLSNRIEFQRRISPAISIILLSIFVVFLVQFNPRESSRGRFIIAVLIYVIYSNSQYILQVLIEKNGLPIFPGVYLSHIIFGAIILIWLGLKKGKN